MKTCFPNQKMVCLWWALNGWFFMRWMHSIVAVLGSSLAFSKLGRRRATHRANNSRAIGAGADPPHPPRRPPWVHSGVRLIWIWSRIHWSLAFQRGTGAHRPCLSLRRPGPTRWLARSTSPYADGASSGPVASIVGSALRPCRGTKGCRRPQLARYTSSTGDRCEPLILSPRCAGFATLLQPPPP